MEDPQLVKHRAWLDYGFRLFFLGAAFWSVAGMILWTGVYTFQQNGLIPGSSPSVITWHAYEMIFGYTGAVVAGFLLTAAMNWTGRVTATGRPLAGLFGLWVAGRLIPFFGGPPALVAARGVDILFFLLTAAAVIRPCILSGNPRNSLLALLSLGLMSVGCLLNLLGATGRLAGGDRTGTYLGLYVLVFLTLLMGRRVIPFFIERAAPGTVRIRNFKWVDGSLPPLVLGYVVCDLVPEWQPVVPYIAVGATLGLGVRLYGWWTPGLWRVPLLWVLYLGYAWFGVGFSLRAVSLVTPVNPFLTVHAFTAGGIGLMTLGMMARVALGHSGRNVGAPPHGVSVLFGLVAASALIRVFFPLAAPGGYRLWIGVSQFLWIAAFAGFLLLYTPILTSRMTRLKVGL